MTGCAPPRGPSHGPRANAFGMRLRRAPGHAGVLLAGLLSAVDVMAGPPTPTLPPDYFVEITGPLAGETGIEVVGRTQHVRPESLDLVRRLPRAATLARLESWIGAEGVVLQAREPDPERFRAPVPRGVPLSWGYELYLTTALDLPQVAGHDYWCAWLGGVLLEPRVPVPVDTTAVSRVRLRVRSPGGGAAYGPWPRGGDTFEPESVDDLTDAFVAAGRWRVHEQVVAACTLQVALVGSLGVDDGAWIDRLAGELASLVPLPGRALICVAPGPGPLAVYAARRSWLVLWPGSESALPTTRLLPGRSPLGEAAAWPDSGRSGARLPGDRRSLDR